MSFSISATAVDLTARGSEAMPTVSRRLHLRLQCSSQDVSRTQFHGDTQMLDDHSKESTGIAWDTIQAAAGILQDLFKGDSSLSSIACVFGSCSWEDTSHTHI